MSTIPLKKYESVESFVFLDQRGGRTGSSMISSPRATRLSDVFSEPPSLTVAVALRRVRLLVSSGVVLVIILGLTYTLGHGVELSRFADTAKTPTEKERLADNYNSYSGIVVSAFGKPIEMFVSMLVQVISLRFMAQVFMQTHISWKLRAVTLILSGSVGALVSNGFNALNVQLRPQKIKAVILASDLSVKSALNTTTAALTSDLDHTVPENTPRNLMTNTVLRNTVLSRNVFRKGICEGRDASSNSPPTIDYTFAQRDWQSRLLQEAIQPTTLRMIVNPTNQQANKNVKSTELPMNASTAADLLLYTFAVAQYYVPWGNALDHLDREDVDRRYPPTASLAVKTNFSEAAARVAGLLPVSTTASELEQRAWFVKSFPGSVARQFNNSINTSREDISVEFSHVDISPQIVFDAVTIEAELDPSLLATAASPDNSTRYTQIYGGDSFVGGNCGPWPARCLIQKPTYTTALNPQLGMDPNYQVVAFGTCVNVHGTDQLWSETYGSSLSDCADSSNTSMMIVTIGKRLVADSLEQNKADNVTKESEDGAPPALLTNLRKIYTITIGRLSWKLEDLSVTFNADCNGGGPAYKCMGLQLPLDTSSLRAEGSVDRGDAVRQRLVVSKDAFPIEFGSQTRLPIFEPTDAIPLITVSNPSLNSILSGDVILPHNIPAGKIEWTNVTTTSCTQTIEATLFTTMRNHMYIEHGLQTSYTTATFFLFQDAVVRDEVVQSGENLTLRFSGNTQDNAVWLSTPAQNAWLTLVGCTILGLGLVAAVLQSAKADANQSDPLAAITNPHAIARVMLVDEHFPALLLHRRVVDDGVGFENRTLEDFEIMQLMVKDAEQRQLLSAIQ